MDRYSYFEVMDRAHVANDHFHEYVETHEVVQKHPELKEAAENVTDVMYHFYCLTGAYLIKEERDERLKGL